jgi:hypothetical protein
VPVCIMVPMSRVSESSEAPRHRAVPVAPGAEGSVAPSLAWKVCAVLPLVLLVVLMSVKVAGSLGNSDSKETSQVQDPGVTSAPAEPTLSETATNSEAEKAREIRSGAPKPSEPPNDAFTTEPATIPDSGFQMPPGDIDQTATPQPTKTPTKSPTHTPSPSPTPTPDEARQQCIEDGVSVLDIAALAACIADLMDP